MEFTLSLDKFISHQTGQLAASHTAHPHVPVVGLVVGHSSRRHSTIAYLSACPKPKPLVGTTIEELNEAEGVFKPYTSKSDPVLTPKTPPLRDYIDEDWISSHCQQLLRCLPGGLDVMGLFILSSDRKSRNDLQRPLIRGLRMALMESDGIHKLVQAKERRMSILQRCFYMVIEGDAAKPAVSLLDLTGSGTTLGPVLSYSLQPIPWIEITSNFSLDLCELCSQPSDGHKGQEIGFEAEFYHSIIVPFGQMVAGSVAAVNGHFRDPNILLNSVAVNQKPTATPQTSPNQKSGGKKGGKSKGTPRPGDQGYAAVTVDIYAPPFGRGVHTSTPTNPPTPLSQKDHSSTTSPMKSSSSSSSPDSSNLGECQGVRPCVSVFCLRGTLACRGWVPAKTATVGDAVYAMQLDLVRSLYARTQLHCEGMQVLDSEEEKIALHQLPRRIFSPPVSGEVDHETGNGICFCDYLFDGDVVADAAETFIEVVGISPERLAMSSDAGRTRSDSPTSAGIAESQELVLKGSKFNAVVSGWDADSGGSGGFIGGPTDGPGGLLAGGGRCSASSSLDRANHQSRDSSCNRPAGSSRRSRSNATVSVGERLSSSVMTLAANVGLTGGDAVSERSAGSLSRLRLSNRNTLILLGSVLVGLIAAAVGLMVRFGGSSSDCKDSEDANR